MNNSELSYTTAPAFLNKLWSLVEDPSTDELICWDPTGESFHVLDQARFARDILPLYFKHRNIASFIRQLNMYGFRKVVNIELANIKVESDDLEFAHQFFIRNHEHLLEKIKRKISGVSRLTENVQSNGLSGNNIMKIINEVKTLKVKQETMAEKFDSMKLENDVLWREVVNLRQQNIKQQEILNKLIQFLMSLVSKERTSIKRKMPLMIASEAKIQPSSSHIAPTYNIAPPPPPPKIVRKATFLRPQIKIPPVQKRENPLLEPLAVVDPLKISTSAKLTDCLDESDIDSLLQAVDHKSELNPSNLNTPVVSNSTNPMISQLSTGFQPTITLTKETTLPTVKAVNNQKNLLHVSQVAKSDTYLPDKEDLVQNLEILQNGIESLRELFSSGQYSIDANTLFELFGSESPAGANSNLLLSTGDNAPYADQNDPQALSIINTIPARGSHLMALNAPPQNLTVVSSSNNILPFMNLPNNDNYLLEENLGVKIEDEKSVSTPLEDINIDDFMIESTDIYDDFLDYDSII